MAGYAATPATYISSAKWSAVAAWAAATGYTAGQVIRQNAAVVGPAVNVGAERCFVCIVGGTSGGSEPAWTTTASVTRGVKFTDNTVTWQEATGLPALNGDLTNTPTWAASKAVNATVSLGHVIKDAAGTHIFIASTIAGSGTMAASEPTWDTAAVGNTTVDNAGANQITWTYIGTSFSSWGAPHARVNNARQNNWAPSWTGLNGNPLAAGVLPYLFVCDDHDETTSVSGPTWDNNIGTQSIPLHVLCVDDNNVPPTSANLSVGARMSCTSNSDHTYAAGSYYAYGLTFRVNVANSNNMIFGSSGFNKSKVLEKCTFDLSPSTNNMFVILALEDGGGGAFNEYIDCTFKFGSTGQRLHARGRSLIRGGSVDAAGTIPTVLFTNQGRSGDLQVIGMDLSALTNKTILSDAGASGYVFNARFEYCKLGSGSVVVGAGGQPAGMICTAVACDDGARTYRHEKGAYGGTHVSNIIVVRDGGAKINSVPISWKVVTNSDATFYYPFKSMPISKWNADTGVTVTATIEGLVNGAAVPNNDEVWMTVNYAGDSGSPLGSRKTNKKTAIFGNSAAALTASTQAWDSGVTARANSHLYAVGDIIKVASNPGRVFFCTTAGTSAGSEPGGFATAIDGGSVTDSGAIFRAACRFKITISLDTPDPQLVGLIQARLFFGKLSTTYYIDPSLTLA